MSSAYNALAAQIVEQDFIPLLLLGAGFGLTLYYFNQWEEGKAADPTKCQRKYAEFLLANDENFRVAKHANDRDLFYFQWCQKLRAADCFKDPASASAETTYCNDHKCTFDLHGGSAYPYDPLVNVNWGQFDDVFVDNKTETMVDYVGEMNAFCAVGCYKTEGQQWDPINGPPPSSCIDGKVSQINPFGRAGWQTCVDQTSPTAGTQLCGAPNVANSFRPSSFARCACNTLAYMHLPNPKEAPDMCPVRRDDLNVAKGPTYTQPLAFGTTFACQGPTTCPKGVTLQYL